MMNIPSDAPTIAVLNEFTLPRYSGARNNDSAPNVFMNVPFTVLKRINQKISSTWYFLRCSNTNCMGNEYINPLNQAFMRCFDDDN
jgi:hypothetical protein